MRQEDACCDDVGCYLLGPCKTLSLYCLMFASLLRISRTLRTTSSASLAAASHSSGVRSTCHLENACVICSYLRCRPWPTVIESNLCKCRRWSPCLQWSGQRQEFLPSQLARATIRNGPDRQMEVQAFNHRTWNLLSSYSRWIIILAMEQWVRDLNILRSYLNKRHVLEL